MPTTWSKVLNPKVLLTLAGILIIGLLLRLSGLLTIPVFADESIYIRWAQIMQAESTLRFLPLSDGKQPLFMWLVIPALKLVSDPLLAGRLISVLAGCGTLLGVAVAAFILFKKVSTSLLAASLWAVLPFAFFFDRLALADSLLTFFFIWTFNFAALAVTTARLDYSLIAGGFLGFAALTKSPAIFAAGFIPSLILLLPRRPKLIPALQIAALIGVIYAVAFGMYNILRLGPQFHMIGIRARDYVYPFSEIMSHPSRPLIPHLRDTAEFFLYFATPLGLGIALLGLIIDRKGDHLRPRLLLALWWLVPTVIQSAFAITLTARYLLFTLPFFIILLAHAIDHIGQHTRRHVLSLIAAAIIVIPSLGIDFLLITRPQLVPLPRIERAGYLEEWTAGTGLQEVSRQLIEFGKAGPVVVGSEGFFGTPFDGLGMYLNGQPHIRVIGVGIWIDSVDAKLTSALGENQVFLVVNSTRFHGDPEKLHLKLLGSYRKADPPAAEPEYLLFFQVNPEKSI